MKLPEISEKSLAIILEIISDGVWDWNAITGDVYRSPGWRRTTPGACRG